MASVDEWIVREYLETQGFLVRQPRKYQVMARAKGVHEEVDLLAVNPSARTNGPLPKGRVWSGVELARVPCAIIAIRGWHSGKFTPHMLEKSPILCLGDLPAVREQRAEALAFLKSRGIDGVLLYRPMLLELAERIDVKKAYDKSDLLQILRILKNYDLLKSGQIDLFKMPRRRKAAARAPDATPKLPSAD